ncbi:hypothetical protein [Amycolatopsis sp. FDAARGOS 1241]|uniref:hypothetical protein n=1 Tax=Amycolatopsis sp. FDAARGOS 1241 TaxID=2778070 RepID=UPI001EF16705|nr:hypothetical protein [Amycolatopsis sp. FDAARGOS 1241]
MDTDAGLHARHEIGRRQLSLATGEERGEDACGHPRESGVDHHRGEPFLEPGEDGPVRGHPPGARESVASWAWSAWSAR